MGIDTYGRIKGYISSKEVLNYIRNKYDKDATSYVKTTVGKPLCELNFIYAPYNDADTNIIDESGFITFSFNGENRSLFYSHHNYNDFENLNYYTELGLEDMVVTHTTHIGLGCYGGSDEIITDIVAHFGGGWVDENDCDDNPFHRVEPKKSDGTIPPVIYVTMDEVERKFGGTVVITDYRR